MQGAALADTGKQRQHNEDRAGVFLDLGLALVVDGMGGHSSGGIAAEWVMDTLPEVWEHQRRAGWAEDALRSGYPLRMAMELANLRICEGTEANTMYRGQGAAAAVLAEVEGGVLLGHIGDCRIYRLRGGALEPMTRDHSLIQEYIQFSNFDLTPEQIEQLPRNVITRALGMQPGCNADIRLEPFLPGDRYLLCSDGLHGMVEDRKIEEILRGESHATHACRRLIEAANEAGGEDNISVAVVGW